MQAQNFPSPSGDEKPAYSDDMPRKLSKLRPKQGTRLLELRRAAKLSQTELAELVGETQRNIAFWEQSDKPPRSDVLPKLAEVLGVRLEDLLTVDRPPARRGGPVGKVRRLFDEVSQLPRRDQGLVIQLVSALVDQCKRRTG